MYAVAAHVLAPAQEHFGALTRGGRRVPKRVHLSGPLTGDEQPQGKLAPELSARRGRSISIYLLSIKAARGPCPVVFEGGRVLCSEDLRGDSKIATG